MDNIALYAACLGVVLFAGVALNRFSRFLKMPILICFLAVGALCGSDGVLPVLPPMNINSVQIFGEIALCFIIFFGGLQSSFRAIKNVFVTGTILATVGVVLTALLTGICSYAISRMSLFITIGFVEALLVGAVFSSTDAAAVFAILRGQKAGINPKLQSLLEYESGSNDPAAFLLTSVMINILLSHDSVDVFGISWNIASGIVWGLGIGAAIGFLLGIFGQLFYNWIQNFLEYNGLRMVAAVAIVLFCYGVTNAVFHANSLMACYVAGITMGNMKFSFKRTFIRAHEGISWLMQILLFTVLGTFFDWHMLFNVRNMVGAVLISLVLMFFARPLVVMLCMIRSPFNWKERIFAGWVGIRGSAPIMLAAMVVAALGSEEEYCIPAQNLFYIVFTVVLFSILFQGSSLMFVAKKLGIVLPYSGEHEPLLEYEERADGREMCQFAIPQQSELIGKTLEDSDFQDEVILLLIKRGNQFLQPKTGLVLQAGDSLNFLGKHEAMLQLHDNFFPEEDFVSFSTFRQLWNRFFRNVKKEMSQRHKKPRKTAR